jgi:N,N'-diacetyllegionaminate synthase
MKIGPLDTRQRVLIVAEIGNNHEGDLDRARKMIREAAATGADAVKFQTIVPERLVSSDQAERLAQLRSFALTRQQFEALAAEAAGAGVLFLSTPFDLDAVEWLDALVPAYKVASGDNDFFPLFDRVAGTGKPVMVSLGFGGHVHAADIVARFRSAWRRHGIDSGELALLHCVAAYPTADEQAGLGAIRQLLELGVTVGYSDHTLGIKAAELAVAAGARIVEKHFTLDKAQSSFRDHQLSADPAEMRALVAAVRRAERMCGLPIEPATAVSAAIAARRSIAAARDLPVGTAIESGDLTWVRPGQGFRPGEEGRVVGKRVRTAIASGRLIRPDDLV